MSHKLADSFDELLKGQYGTTDSPALKRARRLRALFSNVHGKPAYRNKPVKKLSIVQSVRYDYDETTPQAPAETVGEEYVVQASVAVEYDEYVVDGGGTLAVQSSVYAEYYPSGDDVAPVNKSQALEENRFDILEALPNATPIEADLPASTPEPIQREEPPTAPVEISQAKATEDDFIADMKSILSGQKAFDPVSKQTVSKDQLDQRRMEQAGQGERPVPEAKNNQAIFDRIAQSMQYANAYDIGTVELANRFADFDRLAEIQKRAAEEKKAKAVKTTEPPPGPKVDTADFIHDLDAIRKRPEAQVGESMSEPFDTSTELATESLSEARDKVVNQYWPLVRGAKYKGRGEEKEKWNLLLPGINIEDMQKKVPGYTTCGALPSFLLKKLGGIEDPGIISGGLSGVRDGAPTNEKTLDPNFAKKVAGPYAHIDKSGNIFKGGARHLGAWIDHDGINRPKPGDIFLLNGNISRRGQPPAIGLRHIGVIISVTKVAGTDKEEWVTGDAGQGGGADQQCLQQTRIYDPSDRTVTGLADKGIVIGWVDLDLLVQKSAEKIAEIRSAQAPTA